MKLQPGTPVTANVRLERPVAYGAMGSVWLAEHLTLNTKVAVKFISDRLDPDDPEVLERFIREASAAAQIRSSHVVQTFDQGVMRDGTPYIVMEYLDGEGLGERLARIGRLPIADTFRIVLQTAKALGSAHKAGIVHRDIKPDNVFLSTHDDDLHVKILDFGIAKHRAAVEREDRDLHGPAGLEADLHGPAGLGADRAQLGLTNDGVMIGTPEYMSPEQVMSAKSVDHRADLWALAAVAYVCFTGRLPFAGKDVSELCIKLLEADFVRPSALRPDLPAGLDAWFERAFAKSIDDRFQSAREMGQALGHAAPAMASEADPSSPFLRGSQASFPDGAFDGIDRGIRGPTFSGAASDAVAGRRISPSLAGAFVLVLIALGGSGLFFAATSRPAEGPAALPVPGASAAVPDGAPTEGDEVPDVAEAPREELRDEAGSEREEGSDAVVTGSATATTTATAKPPSPRSWRPPPRKNPGF